MLEIKTYKELKDFIKAFGKLKINFLIIHSAGGLGKTRLTEDILAERSPLILNSHATPLAMFKILAEENKIDDKFIVIFDDVDMILKNKSSVAILKSVCDSKENKIVRYTTTSPLLPPEEAEFQTSCKTLLLTNKLSEGDANLKALMTRATVVNFVPPDKEILSFLKTFAKDLEIIKFIEKYIRFSKFFNFRIYRRAAELKNSMLDWKKEIVNSMDINPDFIEFENLKKKYKTEKERSEHFSKSRASYFRIAREIKSKI
jgi:hypothetical protein